MVDVQLDAGVARVFLNRPDKANALNAHALRELIDAIAHIRNDEDLRVVVLGGHGTAFCGGADVSEMAVLNPESARGFITLVHSACDSLRKLPVPVVARLHRAVIGAGLELAAACDVRIASEDTKFSMPEVRLGIPSVVEAALLPRLIGTGRAAWLVLTGESIDARHAYDWGLIEEVASDLDASVARVVKNIVAGEREALWLQKELMHLWEEAPLSTSIAQSIERFSDSYHGGAPNELMKKFLRK